MTDNKQALLRAILAAPDDDLPRLVYADWLDEHGDADRAEFIRVQVRYAGLHPHYESHQADGCPRCDEASALAGLLTGKLPYTGPAPFASDCPHRVCGLAGYTGPRIEWDWHRGFVVVVRGPLNLLRQHLPAIVQQHPVERVEVTDREPHPSVDGTRLWFAESNVPDEDFAAAAVPMPVFARLGGDKIPFCRPAAHIEYATLDLAAVDFSAALLAEAHARNETAEPDLAAGNYAAAVLADAAFRGPR